jgi:hypothetical protein
MWQAGKNGVFKPNVTQCGAGMLEGSQWKKIHYLYLV